MHAWVHLNHGAEIRGTLYLIKQYNYITKLSMASQNINLPLNCYH